MDPADVTDGILPEIEEGLLIVASGYSLPKISGTLEQLSRCFQALAICRLLESGDVVKFRDNLARSAFARRFFLRKSREEDLLGDRRLALSRTEAFFDALAAGHGLLAREIAALSGDVWHGGWEYQDDFLYFLFLHRLVMEPASRGGGDSLALLQQYETALEGDQPPRLAVLRALVVLDQAAFNTGLRMLIEERDAEIQKRKERLLDPCIEMYLLWPNSNICVEGLALIAIARAMRMEVDEDVPLCPPLARLGISLPSVEDPFLGIERERRRSEV